MTLAETNKKTEKPTEIIFPHGIEVDLDEAWKKLISCQFTGPPGRGFGELIQNLLDSFPASVPWHERKGVIKSGKNWVMITDFGEGMDRDRLLLLVTLGGTDKKKDILKIGIFGIGFYSIFNPKLKTRKVQVITQCEGQTVEVVFVVKEPGKRPQITSRILKKKITYSTQIKVEFESSRSVDLCLEHAQACLQYYPCNVTINGHPQKSIWWQAEKKGAKFFKQGHCDGFIERDSGLSNSVTLLCKYEYLMLMSFRSLITGGRSITFDLRDYKRHSMPFIKDIAVTINCNNLNVTISRDSFRMDSAYRNMLKVLAGVVTRELRDRLQHNSNPELILPNQYIMINRLRDYLLDPEANESRDRDELTVLAHLAQARVYRINGRREYYSLAEILEMKSENLPLFYSPRQSNLRWLGGNFKHDFIVLPPHCDQGNSTPDFFDQIFAMIFEDVVNLDNISEQHERLKELVEAGVVEKESLSPEVEFSGERDLTEDESEFLEELEALLSCQEVREVITKNLHLEVKRIRALFFDIKNQKAVIATGLFDNAGKALSDAEYCNLEIVDGDGEARKKNNRQDLILGLHREHELIKSIIASNDPYRLYFSLPILAHELALCQKLLIPYSPCYHLVKEQLARGMRQALMGQLLSDASAA